MLLVVHILPVHLMVAFHILAVLLVLRFQLDPVHQL